jgi:hypothetical protein
MGNVKIIKEKVFIQIACAQHNESWNVSYVTYNYDSCVKIQVNNFSSFEDLS